MINLTHFFCCRSSQLGPYRNPLQQNLDHILRFQNISKILAAATAFYTFYNINYYFS